MLTRAELAEASEIVARHVPPTPQYNWPLLDAAVGAEVWVKHEDATPTGAFKIRGGLVFAARLLAARHDVAGLCSATRGNHGQSLAYAGRLHGLRVVIVVPEGNSVEKNAAMEAVGAELVVHGHDYQAAREHALTLATEQGLEFVPPYHPDLVAGVATYANELFTHAPPLHTLYVPAGMGSGLVACIAVRDLLGLPTEIVGVVATSAPAIALSFAAGEAVSTEHAATFVDGVACRQPDPDAIAAICLGAARVITVPDPATADAMRLLYRTCHHLPEPAGAIALAGALSERVLIQGRRIGIVLTGANMDTPVATTVLAGGTPEVVLTPQP
jgi:threonine dehydratase